MTFYSKKAILAEAEKRGLRPTDRWAGPGDRYLSNWSAVTAKTLRDATVLVSRGTQMATTARCETARFTVTSRTVPVAVPPGEG